MNHQISGFPGPAIISILLFVFHLFPLPLLFFWSISHISSLSTLIYISNRYDLKKTPKTTVSSHPAKLILVNN